MINPSAEREKALGAIHRSALKTISGNSSANKEALSQEERSHQTKEAYEILLRIERMMRRDEWGKLLRRLVVLGFISSYATIILIGTGVLSFPNDAFAVPSVVAVGIVQTYGLAKLAVKYFFTEEKEK